MAGWCFRPKRPGESNREPIQGEFFASDAISDPGTALVREGIQNALDAGTKGGPPVLVRILVSLKEERAEVEEFFGEVAWGHFRADGNGINPANLPDATAACRFIAFEDFSTSGLEGDPTAAFRSPTRIKNHFYHFFRAEGQTDKDASDRGSWGVGKHVFLRASQVSSIFGLTVRADDGRRMLMGKSVLKSHYVGPDYCQDGYLGVPPPGQDGVVLPIEDTTLTDRFAKVFQLERGKAPGLSIVVPWPDEEITDKALIRAVIRDYFHPILHGQLEVLIETPSVKTVLDAKSLVAEVANLDPEVAGDLMPLVELAAWARTLSDEDYVATKACDPSHASQWSEDLFSTDQLSALRHAFHSGEKMAVRVPVNIRLQDGGVEQSTFDLYLMRDVLAQKGRPTFIREGIIISEVSAPRTRGVRALAVAVDGPLAKFLKEAENPSHTQWHHARLKGKYRQGYRSDLEFVQRSIHEIVRLLTAAETKEDRTLLVDYFSIPAPPEEEDPVKTKHRRPLAKPEPEGGPPPLPPKGRPQTFRIAKLSGGFSILPGPAGGKTPKGLDVRVGYDVRRGNPLKKYNRADFDLGKKPILIKPSRGVTLVSCADNSLSFSVNEADFSLHITGFDQRRQLYVKATPWEDTDGSTAA